MLVECRIPSGAGGHRSDTPASWRDSGGTEWVGSIGISVLDGAVSMFCPSYCVVLTGSCVQTRLTWSVKKAEPGQAGDGAAQMPRNREFLDCRAEQWPPTCRWAYLDCAAHFPHSEWGRLHARAALGKGRLTCVHACTIAAAILALGEYPQAMTFPGSRGEIAG